MDPMDGKGKGKVVMREQGDEFGGRSSERERLPPFYSGADLHNDQRLSCLSKLFSAICIIFCRVEREGAKGEGERRMRQQRKRDVESDGGKRGKEEEGMRMRVDTLLLFILECILCARLMKL